MKTRLNQKQIRMRAKRRCRQLWPKRNKKKARYEKIVDYTCRPLRSISVVFPENSPFKGNWPERAEVNCDETARTDGLSSDELDSASNKPSGTFRCVICCKEWLGSELKNDSMTYTPHWTCGDLFCGGNIMKIDEQEKVVEDPQVVPLIKFGEDPQADSTFSPRIRVSESDLEEPRVFLRRQVPILERTSAPPYSGYPFDLLEPVSNCKDGLWRRFMTALRDFFNDLRS